MKGQTMDMRSVAKFTAKTIVLYVSSNVITKTLSTSVPATQKFKTAEIAGTVGGWYISETLEPTTDQIVDTLFDRYANKN